jgi:hypothetical protein
MILAHGTLVLALAFAFVFHNAGVKKHLLLSW